MEQQRELIREKRDYYSNEQIAKAKRLIEEYLDEIEAGRAGHKKQESDDVSETLIQHDKQRELNEPL